MEKEGKLEQIAFQGFQIRNLKPTNETLSNGVWSILAHNDCIRLHKEAHIANSIHQMRHTSLLFL